MKKEKDKPVSPAVSVDRQAGKPHCRLSGWTWCLIGCCSFLLLILIGAIVTIAIYLPQVFKESKQKQDTRVEQLNLEPAYFINKMKPDYAITEAEEQQFEQNISRLLSGEELVDAKKMIKKVKDYYPEGYFVIVTETINDPDEFKTWYDLTRGHPSRANTIVHEMTHGALDKYTYWIEDKGITIKNEYYLYQKLFSGEVLLQYIDKPNRIDKIYLEENKQNITVTLDEVNAYIKSVRIQRAYSVHNEAETVSDPSTLTRQLYILMLHLKHAKEKETAVWNIIVSNKGFAYTMMRVVKMAEAEIKLSRKDIDVDKDFESNIKVYNQNKGYLNEYLTASSVKELEDQELSYDELRAFGIDLTLTKI